MQRFVFYFALITNTKVANECFEQKKCTFMAVLSSGSNGYLYSQLNITYLHILLLPVYSLMWKIQNNYFNFKCIINAYPCVHTAKVYKRFLYTLSYVLFYENIAKSEHILLCCTVTVVQSMYVYEKEYEQAYSCHLFKIIFTT